MADPALEPLIVACYRNSMAMLRQTRDFGRLGKLYYFWDTAYLMTAYSAMMLLKVSKLLCHLHRRAMYPYEADFQVADC